MNSGKAQVKTKNKGREGAFLLAEEEEVTTNRSSNGANDLFGLRMCSLFPISIVKEGAMM